MKEMSPLTMDMIGMSEESGGDVERGFGWGDEGHGLSESFFIWANEGEHDQGKQFR